MIKEFSFWLQPNGVLYRDIFQIIEKLGVKYKAPIFEPHITLLGDLFWDEEDLLLRSSKLAESLKPFTVSLKGICYAEEYFRCLFIKTLQNKSIMDANQMARKVFNNYPQPPFLPHISILYGYYSNETKLEIINELGKQEYEFQVSTLYLVSSSTNIAPSDWKIIHEYQLI